MFIQTIPTADDCNKIEFAGKIAVVIDVLRASSVIITALANGARSVLPAISTEQAFRLYENSGNSAILGGEKNALIIEGFHYGNSPLQYTKEVVGHKQLILKTTNGTYAIAGSRAADYLLIAAFINLEAIVKHLLAQNNDLVLVCAGTNGRFSLDDALCAGMIAQALISQSDARCCDLSRLLIGYAQMPGSISQKLQYCFHLNYLNSIGYENDVDYCLQTGILDTIPRLIADKLVL
jgi:2-phosphosulfolactate phosphatase